MSENAISTTVNTALAEFSTEDYTPKLVDAIYKVVPYAPQYNHYTTVDDAVMALHPNATSLDIERVRATAACAYVRIHRRAGKQERLLWEEEIRQWAGRLQRLRLQLAVVLLTEHHSSRSVALQQVDRAMRAIRFASC